MLLELNEWLAQSPEIDEGDEDDEDDEAGRQRYQESHGGRMIEGRCVLEAGTVFVFRIVRQSSVHRKLEAKTLLL